MNRNSCARAVFAVAACSIAACSAAPQAESTRSAAAALDPSQVFTPITYYVTLTEVDVIQAHEPPSSYYHQGQPTGGFCNVWTPDTGYVDWAALGAQILGPDNQPRDNPAVEACTLGQASGSKSAPAGSVLTQCVAGGSNNLFEQNKPLSVVLKVRNPDDIANIAVAIDDLATNDPSSVGKSTSSDTTWMKNTGDALQLLGTIAPVAGSAFGPVGTVTGFLAAALAVGSDLSSSPGGTCGAAYEVTCAGGLANNPTTSGGPNGSARPDTIVVPLTPAQLQSMTAAGPAVIDFNPTMDTDCTQYVNGTTSSTWCDYNNPASVTPTVCVHPDSTTHCNQDPGYSPPPTACASNLHLRLTIDRDWTTGLAASAKSADMAVVRAPGTIDTFNAEWLTPNLIVHRFGQGTSFTPEFECTGSACQAGSPSSATTIQKGGVTLGTSAVAVSRSTNNLDAFWVDSKGGMYTAFQAGPSYTWQAKGIFAPTVSWAGISIPSILPANASMTAVARSPVNLDVFAIGTDGNVYTSYWTGLSGVDSQGLPNWNAPFAITTHICAKTNTACAGSGAPGGPIAAVARNDGAIDVFYIGKDGGVWRSYWDTQTDWTTMEIYGPSSQIQQASAPATAGTGITATARTSSNVDLFFIGTDGELWTSAWSAGGSWGTWPIPGTAGAGLPKTAMSAVARSPVALDVIFEGPGGNLQWADWSPQTSWNLRTIASGVGSGAGNVSLVAPTNYALQAFFWNGNHQLNTASWSEPACNPLAEQGCSERATDFRWSGVTTLLTAL